MHPWEKKMCLTGYHLSITSHIFSGIHQRWRHHSIYGDPREEKNAHDWVAATAKLLQSCPTLCDPIDGSPPGSSVPGILQARTLEWVAISFSKAWKWKVKVKSLSCVRLLATPWTAAHQAPLSMGFSRQEYWSGVPLPSLWLGRHWQIGFLERLALVIQPPCISGVHAYRRLLTAKLTAWVQWQCKPVSHIQAVHKGATSLGPWTTHWF